MCHKLTKIQKIGVLGHKKRIFRFQTVAFHSSSCHFLSVRTSLSSSHHVKQRRQSTTNCRMCEFSGQLTVPVPAGGETAVRLRQRPPIDTDTMEQAQQPPPDRGDKRHNCSFSAATGRKSRRVALSPHHTSVNTLYTPQNTAFHPVGCKYTHT